MRRVLLALVLVALAGCRRGAPAEVTTTSASVAPVAPVELPKPELQPGGCATLTDAEAPDTLRMARGAAGLVLYANDQAGLAVVDVSDADRPKVIALSEAHGTPLGVFETGGAALLAYEPWDRPNLSAVRAIAVAPPYSGRSLGDISLTGTLRDARRVGDVVVIVRELPRSVIAVTSFAIANGALVQRGEVTLAGRSPVAGATPRGVVVAGTSDDQHTRVRWVEVDPQSGALRTEGSAVVDGAIASWRRPGQVIDVTEDGRTRLMLCPTLPCASGGDAVYADVDFATPREPKVLRAAAIPHGNDAAVGFAGTELLLGRGGRLTFYETEHGFRERASLDVRGTIGSIIVRDAGDVVTVGWTGSAATGKRAIVHHVDARSTPRLVGAATFGGDWTWTRAYGDERAVAFDPFSSLAALTMTTTRNGGGPFGAAQILSLDMHGLRPVSEEPLPFADRLLFVNGRLLAFSADGVSVVHWDGERSAR